MHTDPELAAAVANAVVDAYVAYSLSQRRDSSSGAETWLSARLEQLEDELKTAEQKLQQFKQKNKLLSASLDDTLNGLALRIVSFNRKLDELQVKRIGLGAEVKQLKRLKRKDPMNDPSLNSSSVARSPMTEETASARTRPRPSWRERFYRANAMSVR